MKLNSLLLCCAVLALPGAGGFASVRSQEQDGSVFLPLQMRGTRPPDQERQVALSRAVPWREFVAERGAWSVLWNEATGTPHRAFGPSFDVSSRRPATGANIREVSEEFVRSHAALLGVDPAHLRFVRASNIRGKWYVSFVQTHGGLDVLLSEVELRISADGRMMAFGADAYPGVNIPTSPSLSPGAAARAAEAGLVGAAAGITSSCTGKLFVLPVTGEQATEYHLVYEVLLRRANPPGNFVAFVDAMRGELLWRHNRVRFGEVRGRSEGMIHPLLPTDPGASRPFGRQTILIDALPVTTDSAGLFGVDISVPASLSASLSGTAVSVHRADGPDASITAGVNPGDSVLLRWDDGNSHPAERDGFFHTNVIHTFITTLDPLFTEITYSMPCAVNINQTCNAFWDGDGINFFQEGGGCPNTAQMPDVVYHEYGHGINDKLYEQLGRNFGMINGATHEGMADVAAAVILDDPRVGRGFFGPGTILRSLLNTSTYPQHVSSDPHVTGLILGGAFWDLRVATTLETMRALSHFAKYGLPDDVDDGAAFSEWFLETLLADDDDGDLGNGTPHGVAILAAFNAHGIGGALYFRQSFSHAPLPSTDDTTQAYTAVFSLGGIPGTEPDSVRLVYSVDGFASGQAVDAEEALPSSFAASIPPQPGGTIVRYYISAFDPVGRTTYVFPSGAPGAGSYHFMVGRQEAEPGVLYAASSGTPTGRMYRLDPATGAATLIGPTGISTIHALAVHPVTRELFAFSGGPTSARVFKMSPRSGDAFEAPDIPLGNMRAASFGGGDTLFLLDSGGRLYRSVSGDTVFVGSSPGYFFASLTRHPVDGTLWASVKPPVGVRDRIYTLSGENGEATLIGSTGDNLPTPALTFGPHAELFALKGSSSQPNTLLRLSTATAAGTLIGSTGISGLVALAMSGDSVTLSAESVEAPVPAGHALEQNYPNPFNGETKIGYRVRGAGNGEWVKLVVYDVLGREVAVLVNERKSPGTYITRLDARSLPSGIYFYRLQVRPGGGASSSPVTQVRKMLLLK